MLVIDAANVIGSRPTGWWRDRPGAARRFTEQVRATVAARRLAGPVTIVLEGQSRQGADESDIDGVAVVHAPGEGDDTIAAIAAAKRAGYSSTLAELGEPFLTRKRAVLDSATGTSVVALPSPIGGMLP